MSDEGFSTLIDCLTFFNYENYEDVMQNLIKNIVTCWSYLNESLPFNDSLINCILVSNLSKIKTHVTIPQHDLIESFATSILLCDCDSMASSTDFIYKEKCKWKVLQVNALRSYLWHLMTERFTKPNSY